MEVTPGILKDKNKEILFGRVASELLEKEDVDKAIKICEQGIRKFPMYAQGHFILAKCYQKKGMHDEAKSEFERVLRYDQNHIPSIKELAEISKSNGLIDIYKEYLFRLGNLEPLNDSIINKIKEIGEYNNWVNETDVLMTEKIDLPEGLSDEKYTAMNMGKTAKDSISESNIFGSKGDEEKLDFDDLNNKKEEMQDTGERIDLSQFENKEDDFTTIMNNIFPHNLEQDEYNLNDDKSILDYPEERNEKETLAEELPFNFMNEADKEKTDIIPKEKLFDSSDELADEKSSGYQGKYMDSFTPVSDAGKEERDNFVTELKDSFREIDKNNLINSAENNKIKDENDLIEENFININGDYPGDNSNLQKKFIDEEDNLLLKDKEEQAEDSLLAGSSNLSHLMDELTDFSDQHKDILRSAESKAEIELDSEQQQTQQGEDNDSDSYFMEDENKKLTDEKNILDLQEKSESIHLQSPDENDIPATKNQDVNDLKPKIVTQTLGEILVAQKKFAEAKKVFLALKSKNPENSLYDKKIAFLDRIIALGENG